MSLASKRRQQAKPRSRRPPRTEACPPRPIQSPRATLPATVKAKLPSGSPPHDFSNVTLHPSAPEITAPLRARAVTIGQDIYFHPNQFQPGTESGDALIAHELAHTLQTRRTPVEGEGKRPRPQASASNSKPALEENADSLARGSTRQILQAPPSTPLLSPFDNESSEERTRRLRLIQSIDNAMNRITELLRTGGLLHDVEVPLERNGTHGVVFGSHTVGTSQEVFESYAVRNTRLRRMVRTLIAMASHYRQTPIPPSFAPPRPERHTQGFESEVEGPPGSQLGTISFGGRTAEWADLQAAYARFLIDEGRINLSTIDLDWYYLDPSARVVPRATRHAPRISGGIATGMYLVVPNPREEPMRYWHLTGYDPIPQGSYIAEIWDDDFGRHYRYRGQRIYLPND